MEFVNLTPQTTEILDNDGDVIGAVKPSGVVGLAAGDPPHLMNVPPPKSDTVYIVLPAVTDASDRSDLLSISLEEARRSQRGNVRTHVCHWNNGH